MLKLDKIETIELISNSFYNHEKLKSIFRFNEKNYKKRVKRLITYSYNVAIKNKGVFISKNNTAALLFYVKNEKKTNFKNTLTYIKIILSLKFKTILQSLKEEKTIKKHRLQCDNYLYAWYIAQDINYNGIDSLIEIRNFLFSESIKKNIPILLETSKEELISFYLRAGFTNYKKINHNNRTIWFFKFQKKERETK